MQDRQELMTRAFRVMNEKLFAPRGIPVPELPILTDGSGVFPWEAGATHYRGRQPVSIAVAPIQDDVEAVGVLAQ
jgi:hypothetical protein